ncbi:MAG: Beta-ketoadipate enol-lactone hydrolase [Frankiales bacterium]|nr:Beta-ketoadipate enol-lactone hydrolase [Frankiales bacterium]
MSALTPGVHRVPVDGGELAVEVSTGTSAPVLAVHGISSNRRLWDWLHVAAPELLTVAPDLRGRCDSLDLAGPSSVQQHADDCVRVLDALGLERLVVCGMSMGGFVAVDLAVRFPDRVQSLVLVDGGYPMATPPGLTPEMLPAVFADRLSRLGKPWASVEEYQAFFVANTAPLLGDDGVLSGYLAHDLDAEGRVRLSGEALLSDAESVFFGPPRWRELTVPVRFTHAEFGGGPDTPPAYPAEAVAEYAAAAVDVRYLPGLDHAGSIMTAAGAEVTAELLRGALA